MTCRRRQRCLKGNAGGRWAIWLANVEGKPLPSDGLNVLRHAFGRLPMPLEPWRAHLLASLRLQEHDPRRGAVLARHLLRNEALRGDADLYANLGHLFAQFGDTETALAVYREVLARTDLPRGSPGLQAAADGLASEVLYADRRDLLDEAQVVIAEAVKESPHVLSLRCTYGGVLVERGDVLAAESLLLDAIARGATELDLAITYAYLALINAARGDLAEARRYRSAAREAFAREHPHVRRLLSTVTTAIGDGTPL